MDAGWRSPWLIDWDRGRLRGPGAPLAAGEPGAIAALAGEGPGPGGGGTARMGIPAVGLCRYLTGTGGH
ncbi:MAG: hypothetical protein U5L11_02365 [Arhodomonas sp.]|nr:hypothetical protein [Arhodomonas sp.]